MNSNVLQCIKGGTTCKSVPIQFYSISPKSIRLARWHYIGTQE